MRCKDVEVDSVAIAVAGVRKGLERAVEELRCRKQELAEVGKPLDRERRKLADERAVLTKERCVVGVLCFSTPSYYAIAA